MDSVLKLFWGYKNSETRLKNINTPCSLLLKLIKNSLRKYKGN